MQACLIKTFRKANRPMSLAANKAYSSKAIREDIAKLEVEAVTPTRSNETRNDEFDKSTHKKRNIVERAIGWIKEYRRIATRNEKRVAQVKGARSLFGSSLYLLTETVLSVSYTHLTLPTIYSV